MYFFGGFFVVVVVGLADLAVDVCDECVERFVGFRKLQKVGEKILYSSGRENSDLGAGNK